MSGLVYFLIPVGMLVTAAILGVGIYSLAKGGNFSKQYSNKLMRWRVMAQAITIAIMMLFLWLIANGN